MEVKPGYVQTDVGVIPEEWEVKRLGDVGSTYGGLTGKTKADFGEGPARYITFMNVMSNVVIDSGIFEQVQVSPTESQNRAKKGDLFFNGSSETPEEVAMCSVLLDEVRDVYLNSFCFGFRFHDGAETDGLFLAYYLRSKEGRELMKSLAQGSTRYNLSKAALLKSSLRLPKLPEQRAIATALSDVDGLLGGLNRLIAKKRDLKQAAMQQLLTGQTRLPGFHGEWEVKRLGTLLQFQVGFPFSSAFFNEKGEGIRLVKNRDLKSDDQVFHYNGMYEEAFVIRDGDVLIGMDGDFLPCQWNKGPALLNQRVGRVVPNTGLNVAFAFYALIEPLKEIEIVTSCTTVKHLSHGDVEGIERPLPPLPEQTAIASVLTEMDGELAVLTQRREKTRTLKQAMMQELLTGKTRLI